MFSLNDNLWNSVNVHQPGVNYQCPRVSVVPCPWNKECPIRDCGPVYYPCYLKACPYNKCNPYEYTCMLKRCPENNICRNDGPIDI